MNIAKEFYIGNTHIKIATDYCENKTPEDVERILEKIARTALQHHRAAAAEAATHAQLNLPTPPVPKKPVSIRCDVYGYCPSCNHQVHMNSKRTLDICRHCGQALDWSGNQYAP